MKNFCRISDFSRDELQKILDAAENLQKNPAEILRGKNILFAFEKPSLRTKVGVEAAINRLGGRVIHVEAASFFGARESFFDTVKNVERWCDAIFARVFSHETILKLEKLSKIPVVNALCDEHHPTQAMADLLTIQQKLGRKKIALAFVGDANNVAFSLIEILLKFGHEVRFAGPQKFFWKNKKIKYFKNLAKKNSTEIFLSHDPVAAVKNADVIYTDTFVSMGEEKIAAEKIKFFRDFQINSKIFSHAKNAGFMHCLPAHRGEEVTDEIMDGKNSWIFPQAENRMVAAMGIFSALQ